MILQAAAALHLTQSPGAGREALQHIHPDADVLVFEGGLEDGGHTRIAHERGRAGDGLRVLPRLFLDPRASGKQQVGLLADFLPDIHRGAWSGFLVGQRLVNEQPQAPWTLQARDVARLGEVLAGQ